MLISLFCDYHNCGSTSQANHNFPDFLISPTFCWPMWNSRLLQVLQEWLPCINSLQHTSHTYYSVARYCVLRNTVVKAMIKVNGKDPILGTPRASHAKNCKIGRAGPPWHRGEILAKLWRTHFWEYCHHFMSNHVFRWGFTSYGGSQPQH